MLCFDSLFIYVHVIYKFLCSQAKVIGPVTSIALTADGTHFFIGTRNAMIYWCDSDTLKPELRSTGHS